MNKSTTTKTNEKFRTHISDDIKPIYRYTLGAQQKMSDFDNLEMDMETETETDAADAPAAIQSKTPASSKIPAGGAGARKNIFFRSTVGPDRTEKLTIGENTPVMDVKETLANVFGLAPDDFHLSHAGRTLGDDASIGDYGIDTGDEVLMIPHSTAGYY